MRDGQSALVSRQKGSLVLVQPASRKLQARGRPVFVVGINNLSGQPVDFRVDQVQAFQHVGGTDYAMQVITYDMLVGEEKNRQIAVSLETVAKDMVVVLNGNREILTGSDEILRMTKEVQVGVEQVAAAAQQAGRASTEATDAAKEQAKGTSELATAIEEIASLADELQAAA